MEGRRAHSEELTEVGMSTEWVSALWKLVDVLWYLIGSAVYSPFGIIAIPLALPSVLCV